MRRFNRLLVMLFPVSSTDDVSTTADFRMSRSSGMIVLAVEEVLVGRRRKHLEIVDPDDDGKKPESVKVASGGAGSRGGGPGHRFRAGESLICRIIKPMPGGYEVLLVESRRQAFLPTQALFRNGEELRAQFVCVHNHRLLLSVRFSNNQPKLPAIKTMKWDETLD